MKRILQPLTFFVALFFMLTSISHAQMVAKEFLDSSDRLNTERTESRTNLKSNHDVIYEEDFTPANDTGLLPEGWTQKKADNALGNNLQDLVEGDTRWRRYSQQFDMGYSSGFQSDWIHTGDASMHINWNIEAEQNVYAITPEIELVEADELLFEFWMYFPSAYHTELDILLHLNGEWEVIGEFNSTDHENLYDNAVVIDITGKVGTAQFAFVYKWTDGIQMNVDAIRVLKAGDNGDVDTYTVTFNVDMTDVEGFDPAEDKVFLTGTLTGWAEPGTENSIELTRKVDAKENGNGYVVLFSEDFEEYEDGDDFSDTDWKNYDVDDDGHSWFIMDTDDFTKVAASRSWLDEPLTPENWLVTPAIDLTEYEDTDNIVLEWFVFGWSSTYYAEHYKVVISTNGDLVEDFSDDDIVYEETLGDDLYNRSVDISAYAGHTIYIAFVHYDSTDESRLILDDIYVKVMDEVDEVFFTATVAGVEAGELLYKYFSDAFVGEGEDGWAGGEWAGDPNRSVVISGDVTLDDVWGDQPSSIVENELTVQGINLFPNPVRNTLYVENTDRINQIRIFDLTGRMVYNQMVNDNTTSVNVSEFTKGVYIMQVMTVSGVTSKKFNVVK